jgi:hypothetical protein
MARFVDTLASEVSVSFAARLGTTLHWFRRGVGFEAVRIGESGGVARVVAPAELAALLDVAS